MDDQEILKHIGGLVDEEHALYRRSEEHTGLQAAEQERLQGLEVALDQLWDLLDRRRALRSAGRNPDEARLRAPATVENYLQ
jgi:hypothetical protein